MASQCAHDVWYLSEHTSHRSEQHLSVICTGQEPRILLKPHRFQKILVHLRTTLHPGKNSIFTCIQWPEIKGICTRSAKGKESQAAVTVHHLVSVLIYKVLALTAFQFAYSQI